MVPYYYQSPNILMLQYIWGIPQNTSSDDANSPIIGGWR
jgi:hypothetical protein